MKTKILPIATTTENLITLHNAISIVNDKELKEKIKVEFTNILTSANDESLKFLYEFQKDLKSETGGYGGETRRNLYSFAIKEEIFKEIYNRLKRSKGV